MAAEKVNVSDLHMYVCIIYLCIKDANEYQTLTPRRVYFTSKGRFTTRASHVTFGSLELHTLLNILLLIVGSVLQVFTYAPKMYHFKYRIAKNFMVYKNVML